MHAYRLPFGADAGNTSAQHRFANLQIILISYAVIQLHYKVRYDPTSEIFFLLAHNGSHREVYQEFQPSYDTVCRRCQGLFRPQVPCTPVYTAQLLTLHQHRANNQFKTANQI